MINSNEDFERFWKEENEKLLEKYGITFDVLDAQDPEYHPNLEKIIARRAYERGALYHRNRGGT